MRIDTPAVLAPDTAESFLKLYRAAFEPLETRAAARQSLTDDEFLHEMADPAVTKWVARDDLDRPAAMTFMVDDLSMMPWVSVPYYQARFPEQFERKAIYYVGALLVSPEHRGGDVATLMLAALFRRIAENDGICAFDCCQFNVDTVKFVDLIARVGTEVTRTADLQEIDVQRYYAFDLRGARP